MKISRWKGLLASLLLAAAANSAIAQQQVTGAGATFPAPLYAKWADAYNKATGVRVNYQSVGSGAGLRQIRGKTVDFGASDMPLSDEELAKDGLIQFPTVIGGVVPVVNVPGIKPGQLTLDGATLAAIYQGKIARWDDAAIKKLNPGLNLPGRSINVVHRSDGSGTTFIFATYLSRVSPSWKADVGADTAIDWPTGVGAKGNEGAAGNVAQLPGSIGYVEYAYAKQNHLAHVKMQNKAGQTVEPTVEAFRSAASNADWNGAAKDNFYIILVDQPGAQSWPITATTYILMYKNPSDPKASQDALKFFQWSLEKGDQLALGLDYVPLPENAVKAIEASWKGIAGSGM
jgi:phosphate transport system substrate-binding protein